MSQRYLLSVSSQVEHLSKIASFVEQAAQASGMNEDQVYDVQMAVDEACTNVIEHAYHGRGDGTIDITCERRNQDFVVTIRDFGDRFDPRKVARPRTNDPLSRRSIGGLGLFFMNQLMDGVKFEFTRNGNRLTMVKKIQK